MSLVSSQLFVVIAIVLLGVLFKSTSAVAVCTTLYLILATSLTVLVKWAANNFWLPRSWQTCLKVRHASTCYATICSIRQPCARLCVCVCVDGGAVIDGQHCADCTRMPRCGFLSDCGVARHRRWRGSNFHLVGCRWQRLGSDRGVFVLLPRCVRGLLVDGGVQAVPHHGASSVLLT